MTFTLNGEAASGSTAAAHFIEWCLRIENENEPVAHCALDASRDFQEAAYRSNMEKREILKRAGIEVH